MFLKILIFLLIINKIISDDSNSGDNGNENSNSKPSDEFVDSVDVREHNNEQQPFNSIDKQNIQEPQFNDKDDTNALPLLNNEENNRINEYTTEKIKEDEEDQLNNEGSGSQLNNLFIAFINFLIISTTIFFHKILRKNFFKIFNQLFCCAPKINKSLEQNTINKITPTVAQQQTEKYFAMLKGTWD
uniref:Uncharacterized protein n=1 Tax=Meloidogyne enterolobii TaxID=390850 RepID=A0A6V7WS12_MELEN|nr:unnamed protein product [Meloidogyne enterolobii]